MNQKFYQGVISSGEDDVPIKDILAGKHVVRTKTTIDTYSISSKIGQLKDVKKTRQGFGIFQLSKPDGTFSKTLSDSVMARNWNRLWVKIPYGTYRFEAYREYMQYGLTICVPYSDPKGEIVFLPKDSKVKIFDAFLSDFT